MSLRKRLGNFLLFVALISLYVFWTDFFTSGRIEDFFWFFLGVGALVLGWSMRFSKEAAPPPAPPPNAAPKPGPPPPPKKPGPLSLLFKPKPKPAPPPAKTGGPPPKKGKK